MVAGQVFAVAGAKGGVGKTTTCINLGTEFASLGFETVIVELDLAMANLVDFLDLAVDPATDPTFHDVLGDEAPLSAAVYEHSDGLDVVPSGTTLDGYARTDLDRLPAVTTRLGQLYDYVLFDTPAGASRELVDPVRLADELVLVSTPRVSAIRNAKTTVELAERTGVNTRGLVLTKSGTGASPGAKTIADFLDVNLLGHVPEDPAIPLSQDRGSPVVTAYPDSDATAAYRDIARHLAPTEWEFPHATDTTTDGVEALAGRSSTSAGRRSLLQDRPTEQQSETEQRSSDVIETPGDDGGATSTADRATDGGRGPDHTTTDSPPSASNPEDSTDDEPATETAAADRQSLRARVFSYFF